MRKPLRSASSRLPSASVVDAAAAASLQAVRQALAALAAPAQQEPLIDLARIGGAWGVRGWIKLQPFSADAGALHDATEWLIVPPQGNRTGSVRWFEAPLQVTVRQLKPQGDALVAQLDEIADRDWAQALRGATIALPRSRFPALPEGEFYWVDLVGLAVRNREELVLGTVLELLSNGPQSVLVVQGEVADEAADPQAGKQHLIPFVEAYVDAVDLAAGTIAVDWQPDY